MKFPIDSLKESIFDALNSGVKNFVASAPTGSGKSTRLPLMLAEKIEGKILVLQPRRVAARMLAKFVAAQANSEVGKFAGWHIRFDKNYSQNSKIVFITEGILARMILEDPTLSGVGAIIFDEFHERNIYADVSLALALNTQKKLRQDLVLFVCSASMDCDKIFNLLGENARKLECQSRMYDIEIRYAPIVKVGEKVWDKAALEFEKLARENDDGNFLIFMSGAYEIGKTISALLKIPLSSKFDIYALHSGISSDLQDRAVQDSNRRKVVVATNIAETSLTISGIKFVIDSGMAKVARYDFARGVNTLFSERISLASATQRAGRAGRISTGIAVRLWSKREEETFSQYLSPEILRLQLSQTLLWLRCAGLDFESLPLLDFPKKESIKEAKNLLLDLGAIDKNSAPTRLGRILSAFPSEPRFAKMLLESAKYNCLESVAIICGAIESGRIRMDAESPKEAHALEDMLGNPESELEETVRLCQIARENKFDEKTCRALGIHGLNARKTFESAGEFFRLAQNFIKKTNSFKATEKNFEKNSPRGIRLAVLSSFSDRLCVRLNEGTLACDIVGGKRAEIRKSSKKYASKIFVALDLSEQTNNGRASIMLSQLCPIAESDLQQMFEEDFSQKSEAVFEDSTKRVMRRESVEFRGMPIRQSYSDSVSPSERNSIFAEMVANGKLVLKNWGEAEESFIERVNFAAEICPESNIAKIDDSAKRLIFENMCSECASYSEIKNADVLKYLREWLSRGELELLDYLAPYSVNLPHRKKPVKIRYELQLKRAVVSAKFSDFYDYDGKNLRIADGKIIPTFEILAPNSRPVQITQNLDEFWKTSWLTIKKELKSRYPKHFKDER